MELGSHSWSPAAELFLNSCFSDTVFVTLFRTVVERASCGVHCCSAVVLTVAFNTVVLTVAFNTVVLTVA